MPPLREYEEKVNPKKDNILRSYEGCAYSLTDEMILRTDNSIMPFYVWCSSEHREVALRIIRVLTSPETIESFFDGVKSVPIDLFYLGKGYLDTDNRFVNRNEKYRLSLLLKRCFSDKDVLSEILELIFGTFFEQVSEETQDKIFRKVGGTIAGRLATNTAASRRIALLIMKNVLNATSKSFSTRLLKYSTISAVGSLIGNLLLLGGMAERAIYTAQPLRNECPEIYTLLRAKDLDLLYFLVEPYAEPFVDAIKIKNKEGRIAFDNLMTVVSNEM